MRKLILLVACITAILGKAQEMKMGVKAGVNIASLRGGEDNNVVQLYKLPVNTKSQMEVKAGVYFGAYLEKTISDKGSAVGEAIFTFQGARKIDHISVNYENIAKALGYSVSGRTSINIIQLNMPVYYKYEIFNKLFLNAGGYVGFIIGSNVNGLSISNNTIDLGLLAGTAYQLSDNLSAEVRYNFGLFDISDVAPYKNSVFQIGVNYKLK
ncbi:MAG: porin family protein [Flavobacteriaceae bacterium]|nr:porin family protein [Flavobacteriaceae bacterium]